LTIREYRLGIGNRQARAFQAPSAECDGGQHELGLRRVEVLAKGLDQVHEVLLVAAGMSGVLVLVALPPDKSSGLVASRARIVLANVGQDLLGVGNIIVILLAGIPVHLLLGLPFHPGRRPVLVSGIGPAIVREPLASGRKKVPAQASVADTGLEHQDGFVEHMADDVAKLQFDADVRSPDRQPLISQRRHLASSVHHLYVSDFLSLCPLALIIEEMRILVFLLGQVPQRSLLVLRPDPSKAQHIRLSQQDEHLHRLVHCGRLGIRVR
jgi:hypothetical protein